MGRLGYDPDNIDTSKGPGKQSQPGRYPFHVVEADEKDFRRSSGLRIVMEVAVGDRDVKVYENLVYVKQSQWRLKQFLESTGFDYDDPPDVDDLLGAQGVADFKLGPKKENDRRYLEVDMFLEQGTQATGPSEKGSAGAGSQPALPSRRRGRGESQGSQSSGGGRRRGRRQQRDDDPPPREDGGKRGRMLGGGAAEPERASRERENADDELDADDLPF